MRPDQRWFPTNATERAAWFRNFSKQFAELGLTLGFTQDEIDAVNADNDVVQFLAGAIRTTKAYTAAIISFQQTVLLGDIGATTPEFPPQPAVIPPAITPTGVFERLEKIVRRIRVAPNYTSTTGALLGIVPRQADRRVADDHVPELKVSPLSDRYSFEVRVARRHFDGFLVEIRRSRSDKWENVSNWYRSPAHVVIEPGNDGEPEVVSVRVRMLKGNDPIGNYSRIATVTIEP